jgi:crossover junction endodeoxyribonuclease RuvC
MGIDPGTRITGYGIIRHHQNILEPIDFGCIRPPVKFSLSDRYLILFESLEQLIEKYAPSAVAVETQFVKKNVQSAMKLGMARGMVILAAARKKIPLFEYAPKKAKLAVVGYGQASKFQVQKMVQMLLKINTHIPEDAADSLALAICHTHHFHLNTPKTTMVTNATMSTNTTNATNAGNNAKLTNATKPANMANITNSENAQNSANSTKKDF